MKSESDSSEFLIACMAYCLLWELAGSRAKDAWGPVREWCRDGAGLTERQSWMVELYEERPPTVQEERSLLARLHADATLQSADYLREAILELIPQQYRNAAERHSLMVGLHVEPLRGVGRFWRKPVKRPVSALKVGTGEVTLADREYNFIRFLGQPYFLDGFRQFWRRPPKCRSNVQTRVLLTMAAALSQMVLVEESELIEEWMGRLEAHGHYTRATYHDLRELVGEMRLQTYDAQELAYYLVVDAREADRDALVRFVRAHQDQFSVFATTFLRRLGVE